MAIVNQAFVDRYWPGQQAIGKRVQFAGKWRTVVGVVANGKYRRLIYDPTPLILTPLAQRNETEVILHVRTRGEPMAMAPAVEQAIHSLNGDLPLYGVTTLKENMQLGSVFERIAVTFAASFGLLALLLAAVGIYGVVSYTTRQRTHEIGIRIALGAGRGAILRQVLRQGLVLTIAGLALGLCCRTHRYPLPARRAVRSGGHGCRDLCDGGAGAVRGGGVRVLSAGSARRGYRPGAGVEDGVTERIGTRE